MTVWVKYNVLNVVVQKTVIMIAVEIDQNQNDLAKLNPIRPSTFYGIIFDPNLP